MLKLLDIEICGFFSHERTRISFQDKPGVYRIMGETGAGKSSVLEAIYYSLFGKLIRGKFLVSELTNKHIESGMYIRTRLESDGKQIVVLVNRDHTDIDKPNGVYLYVDEKEFTGNKNDVYEKIEEVIGINENEFLSLCTISARKAHSLISGTSDSRFKEISSIFNFDKYDDAIKITKSSINENKSAILTVEEKQKLESDLIESLKLDAKEYKDDLVEEDLESKNKISLKIEKIEEKVSTIRNLIVENSKDLGDIEARIKNASTVNHLVKKKKDAKNKLVKFGSTEKQDKNEVRELVLLVNSIESTIRDNSLTVQKVERTYAKNICPVSNQVCPVDVPKKYKDDSISALEKESHKLEGTIKKHKSKLEEKESKLDRYNDYVALKKELSSFDDVDEGILDDIDESIVQKIKSKITKLNSAEKDGNLAKDKNVEKLYEIRLVNEKNKSNKKAIEGLEVRIRDLDSKHKELSKKTDELKFSLSIDEQCLIVLNKLKMNRTNLVLGKINELMCKHIEVISNGEYSAKLKSTRMDSKGKKQITDFEAVLLNNNVEIPSSMVSDGQEAQLGLSIMLSVCEVAQSINNKGCSTVFLDEPFGPISDGSINNAVESIIRLSEDKSNHINSVFLVSHREFDCSVLAGVFETTCTNGITGVKYVS